MTDSAAPTVLIVDDDRAVLDVAERFVRPWGFDVVRASNGREAIERLGQGHVDVVMVDLRMPEVDGLGVLAAIRDMAPETRAILMSAHATDETRLEAVKLGALDCLAKPLDWRYLQQRLGAIREDLERRRSIVDVDVEQAKRLEFCGMIGRSAVMQELFELIRRLAPYVRVALVTGETGSGKELVARALHKIGPRREKRFVAINCSAVVESLFESELFGHVRGAFTGATDNKVGLFEAADGGTIFLDELGELPLTVQAKLLRVLESGEITRVGSLEPRKVNVNVIAATNRDLRTEIAASRFRSDLFYRLNVIEIPLPPLRARREDIPYLTAAFVRDTAERLKKPIVGVTGYAERLLSQADWAGNVRELRNVVERACILCDGAYITDRELRGTLAPAAAPSASRPVPQATVPMVARGDDDDVSLAAVSRDHVLRVLERTRGNKKAAAELLGVSRRAFYRLLGRLELDGRIKRRA